MNDNEDGPLEDWTVKELKEECKTLGLSDKGKKAELIERIKESRASNEIEEPSHKEAAIDESPAAEDLVEETPAPTQSEKEEESQSNEALIEETQVQ